MNAFDAGPGEWTLPQVTKMVDEARHAGRHPRVHPNGFIQLDLGPVGEDWEKKQGHSGADRRLHIWNPPDIELPHQETVNEIHDHVFDMKSTVVRGVLTQKLYEFSVGGVVLHESYARQWSLGPGDRMPRTHEIYQAVYDQKSSSRLEPTGIVGFLQEAADMPVPAGSSYTQPAFTLHDSEPRACVVTVMEKKNIHEGNPIVVCPRGQPPDNDFDRATVAPGELLWEAINAAIA